MQTKSNIIIDTASLESEEQSQLSPYMMFKYSIRSKLTRNIKREDRIFFDFIQFKIEIKEIEIRCNRFVELRKININWILNQII